MKNRNIIMWDLVIHVIRNTRRSTGSELEAAIERQSPRNDGTAFVPQTAFHIQKIDRIRSFRGLFG